MGHGGWHHWGHILGHNWGMVVGGKHRGTNGTWWLVLLEAHIGAYAGPGSWCDRGQTSGHIWGLAVDAASASELREQGWGGKWDVAGAVHQSPDVLHQSPDVLHQSPDVLQGGQSCLLGTRLHTIYGVTKGKGLRHTQLGTPGSLSLPVWEARASFLGQIPPKWLGWEDPPR
eukprot:scaffold29521_cov15-Tisochrysis_lutea.AAC.1